jgi:hypothetical protein
MHHSGFPDPRIVVLRVGQGAIVDLPTRMTIDVDVVAAVAAWEQFLEQRRRVTGSIASNLFFELWLGFR